MTKLLKTDLYKMFKTTSFWIISIIIAVLTVLFTFTFCYPYTTPYLFEGMDASSFNYFSILKQIIISCTLISMIFVSMFSVVDFSNGTIKIIASKGFSRVSMYFSKFISLIVASTIFSIIPVIVSFIFSKIMLNNVNPFNFYTLQENQAKQLLLVVLGILAYITLTVLISTLLRKTSLAVTITILLISFETTVTTVINLIIKHSFNLDFSITPYTIGGAMQASDHFLRATIVLLVFSVVFFAIGAFVFKKRDIN